VQNPRTENQTLEPRRRRHETLGQVLQADADRERARLAEVYRAVADPDRQTFRKIVQRDRDHEQPG
jgi:hypothetical protein